MRSAILAPKAHYKGLYRLIAATLGTIILLSLLGTARESHSSTAYPVVVVSDDAAPPLPAYKDPRFASLADLEAQLDQMRAQRRLKRPLPESLPEQVRQRAYDCRSLVEQYAQRHDLPPEMIFAMIERESMFDPDARSNANAIGLMQIIPDQAGQAASRYLQQQDSPTDLELFDSETNIRHGTAYLRLLMDHYFDDIADEDVRRAVTLAAYNWGPGNLRQLLAREGTPDSMYALEILLYQHAPAETRRFVRGVTRRMPAYS